MILNAHSLPSSHTEPSRQESIDDTEYNLYRCGTHPRIIRAIEEVAEGDHDEILCPVSRRDFLKGLGGGIVILFAVYDPIPGGQGRKGERPGSRQPRHSSCHQMPKINGC